MDLEHDLDPHTPGPSLGKRMVVMVLGVLGFAALIAVIWFAAIARQSRNQPRGEPPQTVTTTTAVFATWQPSLRAVGTLRAARGADLAFEVAGVVTQVGTPPGSDVQQGQLLVQLNDAAETAQLQQLEASLALAKANLARAAEQLRIHAISQGDFEAAEADFRIKEASARQAAATVAKKRLSAPFPGRVGLITTSPGAYLTSGASVVTLQQLDPILVDFYLPQRHALALRPGQKVSLAFDAFPERSFTGRVTTLNPKVDAATRNIQVEAVVANPAHQLLPGMFAAVTMEVGAKDRYLTLPQTAITYNPYGATVFIAKKARVAGMDGRTEEGLVAEQVFVTLGLSRGDQVAILKGLDEGSTVVTSGGLKLKNGTPLVVDNRITPANDPGPSPQEQ